MYAILVTALTLSTQEEARYTIWAKLPYILGMSFVTVASSSFRHVIFDCWSQNEHEDQGEGVQNSGKTSTDVRGRDMGIEEGTGKEIGGRRNENAAMYVQSYEAGQDQKWKNKRDNESGGNHKESTGKKVEVVRACDAKRGTLRRKEGNGNESTGEKEERKTY